MIVAVARRLQACARAGDTAARIGGDEFALLVEDVTAAQVTALADRVLEALGETPVEFSGRTTTIGASIGIAVAGPGETTETLLRNADLAMYEAKLRGRYRHVLYEPAMHATVVNRFRLEAALQTALSDGAITLAYQPIVDLRTGAVVGFEALARWSDPMLGEVPPAEFIPVAEETGLIHELGRWAIDQACRELTDWRSARGAQGLRQRQRVSPPARQRRVRILGDRHRWRSMTWSRPLWCWRSPRGCCWSSGAVSPFASSDPTASGSPSTTSEPATPR